MFVLENGEEIRMIDDAFAKVCDLMNDPSLEVRAAVIKHEMKMKSLN